MRRITGIIFHFFLAKAQVDDFSSDALYSLDNWANRFINILVDRMSRSPIHHAGLEQSTLAKARPGMSRSTLPTKAHQPVISQQSIPLSSTPRFASPLANHGPQMRSMLRQSTIVHGRHGVGSDHLNSGELPPPPLEFESFMDSNATELSKPDWLRVRAPITQEYKEAKFWVDFSHLNTVCQEAACPNIGECWAKKHVTVMIMGDTCTRACSFCNVKTGMPEALDPEEPQRVAKTLKVLNLNHVVVTSVDRDDLDDGGGGHIASTIRAIRAENPGTTIEVLTPDFLNKPGGLEKVVEAKPDVFNHNLETVPGLYRAVRPRAIYEHSLEILRRVKELDPSIFTKSGIMVGLGEEVAQVQQVMDDMRQHNVDFLTIGQYLQPTPKHHPMIKYVTPEEFKEYERMAWDKGFKMVSASPLTRSSYHAGEDFERLRNVREAELTREAIDANLCSATA